MFKFNRDELKDRIYACWIGKNIGGTMGTPYEGKKQINDIQGFSTAEGVVLPNDDLDLQLIWLKAMEEQGPAGVDEKVLGEYWISYIGPNWNEYGIGKSNMKAGFFPPMSGEMDNLRWKHSNGAWIRSEIWASLYPGQPDMAMKYAYYDACVDHGHGEGTVAALFTAALESMAYVVHDLKTLLDLALTKIPEDSRVYRSVRLVMDEYEKRTDWREVREMVVKDSEDLGWFQAPANIAFTVIGLLWGEGDFKKTLITAINCGDDTDCTGATAGAVMGILYGTSGIPEDWRRHLGDSIVTCCLLKGHGRYPASCTELTETVMNMLPTTLYIPLMCRASKYPATVYDGATDFEGFDSGLYCGHDFADRILTPSGWSIRCSNILCEAVVDFEKEPIIAPMGTVTGKIKLRQLNFPEQKRYTLKWHCPEGFSVQSKLSLHTHPVWVYEVDECEACTEFTITAGERVEAVNNVLLEISIDGRPTSLYVPLRIVG